MDDETFRTSRRRMLGGLGLAAGAGAAAMAGVVPTVASAMPGGPDAGDPGPEWTGPGSEPGALGPDAAAPVSAAFAPLTPGLTYLSVGPYDARARNSRSGLFMFDSGCYTNLFNDVVVAPMRIPPGSLIKELSMRVFNNSGAARTGGLEWVDTSTENLTGVIRPIDFPSTGAWATGTTTGAFLVGPNVSIDAYLPTLTNGTVLFRGARVGYVAPAPGYQAITPTRVYDSRWPVSSGVALGVLNAGSNRTISVSDGRDTGNGAVFFPDLVPAGARAVTYNLTAVAATPQGYLAVTPGGAPSFTASSINWSVNGGAIANAASVNLNALRQLTVFCGSGAAHFIVDITGYYL